MNYHNQIPFKGKCRGDAYGCVYHTQPECAEGIMPSSTLWGIVYASEGINSVCSYGKAVVGQ
ncbi:MAG: hypothetical protein II708_03485, partial [Paludibacteraceae bacterium]|nr:hypothetical protein [Paludibacteraceae bacterium]